MIQKMPVLGFDSRMKSISRLREAASAGEGKSDKINKIPDHDPFQLNWITV
jgi:hypothetical protein